MPGKLTKGYAQACLVLCGVAYLLFQAIRESLPAGVVHDSTPSFLLPIAMAASFDASKAIRFHSLGSRAGVVLAATLLAAVWFEGLAPRFLPTIADRGDVMAMLAGGVIAAFLPIVISAASRQSRAGRRPCWRPAVDPR